MEMEIGTVDLERANIRHPLARGTPEPAPIDGDAVASLEAELKATITDGEVRFDAGTRAAYATDGSNYRQVPIGVVVPRTIEDVIDTIRIARSHGAPILSRGGGTSLAGQCCNVALVIDWTKHLHHVLEIDPVAKTAWVEPGCVLDRLRDQALQYDITFGPDPATHTHCTLGGMIGNNSCGMHAQMAGRTSENVLALDVLLYDGTRMTVGATTDDEYAAIARQGDRRAQVYQRLRRLRDRVGDQVRARYPKIPRRISGYNLDELLPEHGFDIAKALVGSEGTCVTILRAKLRLVDWPRARSLLVLGYEDVYQAADHIMEVLESKPMALEGIDQKLIDDIRKKKLHAEDLSLFPEGGGYLILEFGGADKKESDDKARVLMAKLKAKPDAPSMKLYDDPEQGHHVWLIRESGLGATARVPGQPDTWEGWEDSAVPPEKLGAYLRELKHLYGKFEYDGALYGHFGQGCVHTRINFGLTTAEGVKKFRHFIEEAAELVLRNGGSLSGEHGDGQSRAEFLPKMFGVELVDAFKEFKSIWDPEWKMNPGKVVNAYRIDENLRLGPDYRPADPQTYFAFPDDDHSFARAALRCVGVGKCRREEGGTMCPSYMATREELHSTRGRAHVLHEMLVGDVVTDGWRSEAVHDALDLCLSCKGCKADCPMNVDMATYKAEFLSHYWKGRMRPRHAYAMGFIHDWAKLASLAPGIVNFFGQTPGLRRLAKLAAGVSPKRALPRFADRTFRDWFLGREHRPNQAGPTVVLYPDTFTDFFHPVIGADAVEVMERLGFRVVIPKERLCCGRPLYDYGFLERARRLLRKNLRALRRAMHEGWPIVVLEPSCAAVFRDELGAMFPNDADAKRLEKQVVVFSEFVQKHAPDFAFPRLEKKALLHGHCHHKSVMKMDDEHALLERLGLDFDEPATGCCGMAGSFGFEAEKYELSSKIARHVLLPKVEELEGDALLVADGFSCRTQVEQLAGRRGLHIAQVAKLALATGNPGAPAGHEATSEAEQKTDEKA